MKKSKVKVGTDVGLYYAPYTPNLSQWDFCYGDSPLIMRVIKGIRGNDEFYAWLEEHCTLYDEGVLLINWYDLYEFPNEETKLEFILKWG